MFSGIIAAIGQIVAIKSHGGDYQYKFATGKLAMTEVALGDSIAVNGVCLTAVELGDHYFCADVSNETLSRTSLKSADVGATVNLELALTPITRLSGHIVSGHVDGLGAVVSKQQDGRSFCFKLNAPVGLAKYIAEKGSICINGVSLTVNKIDGTLFTVNIVPHTLRVTTLGEIVAGTAVNLEVDLLARYMERLMQGDAATLPVANITEDLLGDSGFLAR